MNNKLDTLQRILDNTLAYNSGNITYTAYLQNCVALELEHKAQAFERLYDEQTDQLNAINFCLGA